MSKNNELRPSVNLSKKEREILALLAEQDTISEEEFPKLTSSYNRDNLSLTMFSKHPIKMRPYQRKKKTTKSKTKRCRCK